MSRPQHPKPAHSELNEHYEEREWEGLCTYHRRKYDIGRAARGSKRRYNIGVILDEGDSSGWVLKALRECAYSVVSELSDLDEDDLCRRPGEGEWCLKEIAAHLRDAELLALRQMTAIAEGTQRPLPAWDVDVLPAECDYRSAEVFTLLRELRQLRQETTSILWSLSNADWRGSGEHPYRGDVTIETLARELAQHDLEHLWQIRQLKHGLAASDRG